MWRNRRVKGVTKMASPGASEERRKELGGLTGAMGDLTAAAAIWGQMMQSRQT